MSFRRCASLVLALVVSACASSQPARLSAGGGGPATTALRGNSTLIVRAELEEFQGRSAWEVVETLNQRWLRVRRGSRPAAGVNRGAVYARVVVDGTFRGELEDLLRLQAFNIESMRLLSPPDATAKYGSGYMGGVIEVTTIRGR